ncbi:MAG: DNA polymerase III subunit delta' [Bacteroidia bacterium]
MFFKQVVGHSEIKQKLRQMVQEGRIPHAQLFFGPEGSGNLPAAMAFARYVFCRNRSNEDSCGTCSSCIKINKLAHPDLHFVYPIATGKDVKVSTDVIAEFREAFLNQPYMNQQDWFNELNAENKQPIIPAEESNEIIKKLSYTSFEGNGKIMIIWQPEKMNSSAANKVLKMLEEPPDETLFFLVPNNTEQILPTIISRTQLIKFSPLHDEDIASALQERYSVPAEQALNVARMAEGNFREALKIISESDSNVQFLKHFQSFMRLCLQFDAPKLISWIEETAALGREKQKYFIQYSLQLFRECLMLNYAGAELVKLRGEELEFVKKFAAFVHTGNYEKLTEEFNSAYYHIERNANAKILFMDLALKTNGLINLPKPQLAS